ncbi:unnamed protein product [Adineta ricciae]|uniref:Ubiquitin-like domain-containing protein n=1 Tax=Adineta ricciae TaxID=249248 RepID=A0A815R308_ADIRI|nr:unnamed protein product [Adineta ricciae]CAF1471879.1 unnamed protein product [Adineta ricciae]
MDDMELQDNEFINDIISDSLIKLIDRRFISAQIYIKYEIDEYFIKQQYKNDESEHIVDYRNNLKKFPFDKQNISINLSVKLGDTIKDIKRLIEEKESICIEHQTLLFYKDESELSNVCYDSQSLIDCYITDQATLILRLADFAVIFIGTSANQKGLIWIEMVDKEDHCVSNIKMKLAKRYDIADIYGQSLYKSNYNMLNEKYDDTKLFDTSLVKHFDNLILKPNPIADSTSSKPSTASSCCSLLTLQLILSQSTNLANNIQRALYKENPFLRNMNHSPFNAPETLLHK